MNNLESLKKCCYNLNYLTKMNVMKNKNQDYQKKIRIHINITVQLDKFLCTHI